MEKNSYNGSILIRRLVILTDFIILNGLLFAFICIDALYLPTNFNLATKLTFFIANVALFLGEYKYYTIIHVRRVRFTQVLKRTFYLTLCTIFWFLVFGKFFKHSEQVFSFYIIFFITLYLALVLSRLLELRILRHHRVRGRNCRKVVFVGSDPAVLEMFIKMTEVPSAGYIVMGYYADEDIVGAPEGLKKLGRIKDLDRLLSSTINDTINGTPKPMDELFCCLSRKQSDEIVKIMRFCDKNVVHFYFLPRVFGEYRLHLDAQEFMGQTVYTNHIAPLDSISNRMIKRTFDIAVSGVICLLGLPFIPIIALIIKIQSPGPIFFRQARTGLNGDTFMCLKFRSMHVNGNADREQATKDDPRKFAFGDFMRRMNIDEFPQFWNVLKGDMSIVGPRPHMLFHTEVYGNLIDKYMVRHFSKPGITGWSQVTGYRGETKELWQMEERIRRDIWYIENWSFWLDIRIILLNIRCMLWRDKNAY